MAGVQRYHRDILAPALRAVAQCPHPVIAQIEGVCVGGGLEIASQCDLRIAGASARFGVPINRLGFPMAPDEMRGLLALAGRAATLAILLEGRVLPRPRAAAPTASPRARRWPPASTSACPQGWPKAAP
ncbi:hypothetical protein G6F22_020201 [Rhizopus arrhizus]|nr:hypothetical protein G6F22_020201 [Rhizopus arrhizus]